MNVVKVTNGTTSGLPSGFYNTMFFIRAPYTRRAARVEAPDGPVLPPVPRR